MSPVLTNGDVHETISSPWKVKEELRQRIETVVKQSLMLWNGRMGRHEDVERSDISRTLYRVGSCRLWGLEQPHYSIMPILSGL